MLQTDIFTFFQKKFWGVSPPVHIIENSKLKK